MAEFKGLDFFSLHQKGKITEIANRRRMLEADYVNCGNLPDNPAFNCSVDKAKKYVEIAQT